MKTNLKTFLGELEEMGLEDALGAIIEEHRGQISASDDLPNEVDPDLDDLHRNNRKPCRLAVRCA